MNLLFPSESTEVSWGVFRLMDSSFDTGVEGQWSVHSLVLIDPRGTIPFSLIPLAKPGRNILIDFV